MTNQNNAAQAVKPQTVLSFDERERILCQFMREPINHDREMAIAIESAALSKLRAPVADERVKLPPLPEPRVIYNGEDDLDEEVYDGDQMKEYARAALASAPDTAKDRADKILRERMAPISEALGLDVMIASAGNGVIRIFTFEGGPLIYTIRADGTAILRVSWNQPDAPDTLTADQVNIISQAASETQPEPRSARAAVAGEVVGWAAVPTRGKRAGRIYCTCDTREQINAYIEQVHQSNDSLTLWARPLSFADAAPQASAEPPKLPPGWELALNLAIDAIENAPPMDWPVNWPLIRHGLVELRDALKQPQAAKDGGQQRAGDVETATERFALALTPVAYTTKRGAVYLGKSMQAGSENLCTISQAVYQFRAALSATQPTDKDQA